MKRITYQLLLLSGIAAVNFATGNIVNTTVTAQGQQKDPGNTTTLRRDIPPNIPKV